MTIIHQLEFNNNKVLSLTLVDDNIYNRCQAEDHVEQRVNSLNDIPAIVDSILDGYSVWQLVSVPVKQSLIPETFRVVFPNVYQSDDCIPTKLTGTFNLKLRDGTVIPSTYINGGKNSPYESYRYSATFSSIGPGNYNNVNFYTYPLVFATENTSRETTLGIYIGVLPTSSIVNGKIDLTGIRVSAVCIRVRVKQTLEIILDVFFYRGNDSEQPQKIIEFWKTQDIEEFDDDPFNPGGSSDTGGGGGDFDDTSDKVEIPPLPSISAASTGFISLFNPTLAQLNELASYLWSDLFEIDGWKKLFADPMDAILGLSILPVSVPSGGTREVRVGNIGTGISLTVAGSQFVEVDCGSINVSEYWGAYLDYEPYTQAQIFLPYIGVRPISVDEIMSKTVRVVYHVDILTGACCCFVKCGDSVLYTYNGQCSIPIPITGANYTSVVNGVISVAASVGSLVSTGGASAPTAIPAIANSVVNQMKPQIEKSGSISGSAGILNMQTPYLILIRPRQALPSKQNEFIGYPSLITVKLTELSGYTEVQSIHLENIPATQEELAEIQSLLERGVIF